MIFRFYSKASADLIMLADTAKAIFAVLGKPMEPKGIISVDQIPQALQALQDAISVEAEQKAQAIAEAKAQNLPKPKSSGIGLAQRSHSLQAMLKQSLAANEAVLWEVR